MPTIITNATAEELLAMGGDPGPAGILEIQNLTTHDASITRIVARIENDIVEITGTSKRDPSDRHDAKIGLLLSSARAYESLARQITRRANGLIDHHTSIATQRPGQLEKSKLWRENILKIASTDDRVQRAAVRAARENEGAWPHRLQSQSDDA